MANFVIHYLRHQIVRYSVTTYDFPTALLVRSPRPVNPALNVLKPFDWFLWVTALCVIAGFLTLAPLLNKVLPRSKTPLSFWLLFSVCTSQGKLFECMDRH